MESNNYLLIAIFACLVFIGVELKNISKNMKDIIVVSEYSENRLNQIHRRLEGIEMELNPIEDILNDINYHIAIPYEGR